MWAGTIAHTGPFGVGVKCSQEKWDKAKALLAELAAELTRHGSLDYKGLESKWGFFIHLQRTYPTIILFLKGIHLTLDGWRPNRDRDFWKLSASPEDNIWDDTTESWVLLSAEGQETAPCRVHPAPHLQQDLESLNALFHPLSPHCIISNPPVSRYVSMVLSMLEQGLAVPSSCHQVMFCFGRVSGVAMQTTHPPTTES